MASSQDGAAVEILRLWQSSALLGMQCFCGQRLRARGKAPRRRVGSGVDIRLLLLFLSQPQTHVVLQDLGMDQE